MCFPMGDPIQNLIRVVEEGRMGVRYPIHRNEWPDLWVAIDKLVGLSDTEYMFTADQYEPDNEPELGEPEPGIVWDVNDVKSDQSEPASYPDRVLVTSDQWPNTWPQTDAIFVEMTNEDGLAEIVEVRRGQIVDVTPGEISVSPPEDEVKSLPIDIETIALGDAEHWAMWFKAWLEETPDADVDEITLWFARALAVGEVNQHPLIEVTLNDGEVVAMRQANQWEEDHSLDDPIDPEDPGF